MRQILTITDWHPCPLNRLIGCHHGTRSKRKRHDRDLVIGLALQQRLKPAIGPRRVRICLFLRRGQRGCDPDSYLKSALDALVAARLLVDDRDEMVRTEPVDLFRRAPRMATIFELEDLD